MGKLDAIVGEYNKKEDLRCCGNCINYVYIGEDFYNCKLEEHDIYEYKPYNCCGKKWEYDKIKQVERAPGLSYLHNCHHRQK